MGNAFIHFLKKRTSTFTMDKKKRGEETAEQKKSYGQPKLHSFHCNWMKIASSSSFSNLFFPIFISNMKIIWLEIANRNNKAKKKSCCNTYGVHCTRMPYETSATKIQCMRILALFGKPERNQQHLILSKLPKEIFCLK